MTPEPQETAVVVVVPEANPVVGEHRLLLDEAAGWGVPAHVTVVYPFVPPDRLDNRVVARLAAAVAQVPAFDCAFEQTAWFGDELVYLAPQPAEPFHALIRAVVAAFPDHPPYGGRHDDLTPHLTIGDLGTLAQRRTADAAVRSRLPVLTRVDRVSLLAGSHAPDSWRLLHELPLPIT